MNDMSEPGLEPAAFLIEPGSVQARVAPEEWAVRVDLAACYRCAALYRMTDLIYTHISARVPGPDEHFLINAFGLTWDEIGVDLLIVDEAQTSCSHSCARGWSRCLPRSRRFQPRSRGFRRPRRQHPRPRRSMPRRVRARVRGRW